MTERFIANPCYGIPALKETSDMKRTHLTDNKKTTAYNNNPYKREWVLTSANKIPNPYIDISLDEIPLKLEKIILGPNMNDIDTIQVQLEAMLEQQNIKASVEPSKIDVYRNPNS